MNIKNLRLVVTLIALVFVESAASQIKPVDNSDLFESLKAGQKYLSGDNFTEQFAKEYSRNGLGIGVSMDFGAENMTVGLVWKQRTEQHFASLGIDARVYISGTSTPESALFWVDGSAVAFANMPFEKQTLDKVERKQIIADCKYQGCVRKRRQSLTDIYHLAQKYSFDEGSVGIVVFIGRESEIYSSKGEDAKKGISKFLVDKLSKGNLKNHKIFFEVLAETKGIGVVIFVKGITYIGKGGNLFDKSLFRLDKLELEIPSIRKIFDASPDKPSPKAGSRKG